MNWWGIKSPPNASVVHYWVYHIMPIHKLSINHPLLFVIPPWLTIDSGQITIIHQPETCGQYWDIPLTNHHLTEVPVRPLLFNQIDCWACKSPRPKPRSESYKRMQPVKDNCTIRLPTWHTSAVPRCVDEVKISAKFHISWCEINKISPGGFPEHLHRNHHMEPPV
jgi:hypothetical protein